jgi:DNA-binding LacI/PurR family transcriptional regulator
VATIYDVARASGVTAATVSNVITGKGAVSAATRARVEAAIAALGYQPNILARSLATRQTYTLGLILPDIANPFYPEMALEVENTARQHGYSVFLCNTNNDESIGRAYLQQLAGRQADGVIVMPGGTSLEDLAAATQGGLPIVLCNWEEQDELPALPMAGVDFYQAGCLAAGHLLALGHRRIGVIADTAVPHTRHTERVAGFAATLDQAGLAWDPGLLWRGDSSIDAGLAGVTALLRLSEPPTALFCTNDLMALGALVGATALGRAVPRNLSILGVDDIHMGAYTYPPLTTVAIPKRAIAGEATTLLLNWLSSGAMPPVEPVVLAASLLQRGSTTRVGPQVALPSDATRQARERFCHLLDPAPDAQAPAAL